MAAFRPEALVEKLGKLNATQQSIETISQWCIFFRKDARAVVATWEAEFQRSLEQRAPERSRCLLYLANDILQNSRKKGPQFVNEFYHKLPPAMAHLLKHGDEQMKRSIGRMIRVWEERRVFGSSGLKPFTDLLAGKGAAAAAGPSGSGRGRVVLEAAVPSVERLAASLADTEAAHERCRALTGQCDAALAAEGEGSPEALRAAVRSLQGLAAALQNELGQRERVLTLLQQLATPHEGGKQAAEEQLGVCQLRLANLQQRLAALPAAATATPASPDGEDAGQPPGGPHAGQNGGHQQPPATALPVDAPAQAGEPAAAAGPAAAVGAGGGAGLPGGQAGGGGAAAPSFSAADLVAQLAASGTSAQMLLDALAALPKDVGVAPPPAPQQQQLQAEAAVQPMEEEYDPELGM